MPELTGDLSTQAVMARQSARIHTLTSILMAILEYTDPAWLKSGELALETADITLSRAERAFVEKLMSNGSGS